MQCTCRRRCNYCTAAAHSGLASDVQYKTGDGKMTVAAAAGRYLALLPKPCCCPSGQDRITNIMHSARELRMQEQVQLWHGKQAG